jgi:hypothetical protein
MQAQRAFLALCLSIAWLSTTACTVLIAIPYGEVTLRSTSETERVVVASEPSGASVSRDGVAVGTAPVDLDLAYQAEDRVERNKYCPWMPLAGAVDLALAGAAMWASYSKLYQSEKSGPREVAPWAMVLSGLYGAIGLVGVLGPVISGCSGKNPHKVAIPHDYKLRLVKDGWEESHVLSAPVGLSMVSVVIRGLEAADWRRLDSLHTIAAYREYLAKYPSGNLRAEAEEGIAWLGAREQNTVIAYRQYLAEYRQPGKYPKEAQAAISRIFETSPDAVDEESLVQLLADENAVLRRNALAESVRRRRTKSVTTILLDKKAARARREEMIGTLRDLAAGTGQAPDQAPTAREILCGFGADTDVDDDSECNRLARAVAMAHCLAPAPPKTTFERHGPAVTITTERGGTRGRSHAGGIMGCLLELETKARSECEAATRQRETELRSSAAKAGSCSTAP